MTALVVFVGELNPYSLDPRFALYDEPAGASGDRLRRLVLGLPRRVYLGPEVARVDLCSPRWSMVQARARAHGIWLAAPAPAVIVMLGRKVATAFARVREMPVVAPFERQGRLVALPHPSGLCRVWHEPGAFERARALLAEAAPGIPWGST